MWTRSSNWRWLQFSGFVAGSSLLLTAAGGENNLTGLFKLFLWLFLGSCHWGVSPPLRLQKLTRSQDLHLLSRVLQACYFSCGDRRVVKVLHQALVIMLIHTIITSHGLKASIVKNPNAGEKAASHVFSSVDERRFCNSYILNWALSPAHNLI